MKISSLQAFSDKKACTMEKSKHQVSMLPTTNTQRTCNKIIDPKLAVASSVQNHLRDETSVQKPVMTKHALTYWISLFAMEAGVTEIEDDSVESSAVKMRM